MGIRDFFNKITEKFNLDNIKETTDDINHGADVLNEGEKAVFGKGESVLVQSLKAGSAAAITAATLMSKIAPHLVAPIAAAAFLGGAIYKLFRANTQKAALAAISNDGLTPRGSPIPNGRNKGEQSVLISRNQSVKGA